MEPTNRMKALFIIVNAGSADDVVDIARQAGAGGATILNARGAGLRHEMFLGITVDSEKEIILCLVEESTAGKVMESVREKAGIKTPSHAVCFTPVRERRPPAEISSRPSACQKVRPDLLTGCFVF